MMEVNVNRYIRRLSPKQVEMVLKFGGECLEKKWR
jgi:hypothetical protein